MKQLLSRLAQSERALVGLMLAAQLSLFAFSLQHRHGAIMLDDSTYYETPAWNLLQGHGYTLETSLVDDPWLTLAFRARHPEQASSAYVPATTFAPGYGFFLVGLYAVSGRHPMGAVLANGLMLIALIVCMWRLVRQFLDGDLARLAAAAMLATFPGWAFAASAVMSDVLHTTLMMAFALVFFVERPSLRRSLVAGALLGAAIMVRPYPVLLPIGMLAWWLVIRRVPALSPRWVLPMALVAWSFVGAWTVRNHAAFGKIIPFSSMGLGRGLWQATFVTSWWEDAARDPEMAAEEQRLRAAGIVDWHHHDENVATQRYALERIKERPGRYVLACARRVVRLWVSAVVEGVPRIILRAYAAVQLTQFALLVVGLLMGWRSRQAALAGVCILVVFYWATFIPFSGESRVMLPARGLALALAALALARLWRRWRGEKLEPL